MKKTAIVLIVGIVTIAMGTSFLALGRPPGPPSGPRPHMGAPFGGPPGPHHGPPPPGGALFGGPPGPPPPGGPPLGLLGAPPPLLRKLKLTDEQRKQMRLKYVDFQNKTRQARMALMGLNDEKRTMMISGTIDQAKLAKCDEGITKLTAEVMKERLKMEREQLADLTQEQIDRLADFPGKMEKPHHPKKEKK